MIVVDAHEDLAWNMLTFGRDYTRSVSETRKLEAGTQTPARNGNTLLGWNEWLRGRAAVVFATLNAAPMRRRRGSWDCQTYSNAEQAYRLYGAQLEAYHRLVEQHAEKFALILKRDDLERVVKSWEGDAPSSPRVGLVILMEGADGVRRPAEIEEWYQRGVRIVAPAWIGTRYAGGTGEPGPFSDEGFALLEGMAELGMVLDLSHLAEEALRQALERYPGTVIASHSNARALLPDSGIPDRHLEDEMIHAIAEREGVIGVVVYNKFLRADWHPSDGRESVSRYDVLAHIDHICQLVGDAQHVGIGSDFDGGLGLEQVPRGFESVADLLSLGDELGEYGYSPAQVEDVLGGNWLRILRRALPEA